MLFLKNRAGKIKEALLDAIFPKLCINCKKEGSYICRDCYLYLSEADFICPICGDFSFSGKTHEKCLDTRSLDGLISIWDYEGVIKKALLKIKEERLFHIAEEITDMALFFMFENKERFSTFLSFLLSKNTVLTYVPISKKRKKFIGFNHSDVLANKISKMFNVKKVKLLEKTKDGKILCIKKSNIKNVVIIDDFWVSGSTMKECSKILKENGIKKIWGFTVAKYF